MSHNVSYGCRPANDGTPDTREGQGSPEAPQEPGQGRVGAPTPTPSPTPTASPFTSTTTALPANAGGGWHRLALALTARPRGDAPKVPRAAYAGAHGLPRRSASTCSDLQRCLSRSAAAASRRTSTSFLFCATTYEFTADMSSTIISSSRRAKAADAAQKSHAAVLAWRADPASAAEKVAPAAD